MHATELELSRFAVREAQPDDADGIARAHVASWRESYRGILPDSLLDRIDVGQRVATRRRILRDRSIFQLVAYERTHGEIVGFCDAGASRRDASFGGEVYAIYIVQRAKRYGIGREMFDRVKDWLGDAGKRSLIVWVLEDNHHARQFYAALGGRVAARLPTSVGGVPVVEIAYAWDRV